MVLVSLLEVSDAVRRDLTESAAMFVLGSIAFNIDRNYCASLRAMRDVVGTPWGFVLEMHGWWHITSGLSVYYFIVLIEYLCLYFVTRGSKVTLEWKSSLSLPRLDIQHTKTR